MAKISKKSTPPGHPASSNEMAEFIMESMMEGMEDCLRLRSPEPMSHIPHLDMFSTDTDLVVEVEMPGVKTKDIDIKLFKSTLNIRALKYECFDEKKVSYICMERTFGRIFKTVELPVPVNTSTIKASCKNGVLTIIMPRVEEKRGKPKTITIEPS